MRWPDPPRGPAPRPRGHSPHPLPKLCCGSRWCQRGALSVDSRLISPPAAYTHSSPQAHLPAPLPLVLGGGAPEFPSKPAPAAGCRAGSSRNSAVAGGGGDSPEARNACRPQGGQDRDPPPAPRLIPAAQGGTAAGPSTPGSEDPARGKNQRKPTWFPPPLGPPSLNMHQVWVCFFLFLPSGV